MAATDNSPKKTKAKKTTESKSTASDKKSAPKEVAPKDKSESTSSQNTNDSSKKESDSPSGKSQKETISTSDVHYGYFSSVRTPAYRKGWDEIFGNSDAPKLKDQQPITKKNTGKKARIQKNLDIDLSFDDLPTRIRNSMLDEIAKKTRRKRERLDKQLTNGKIKWRIRCQIKP